MKKLNSQYDKLNNFIDQMNGIRADLEEKRDAIEANANDAGRDMTEKEQDKYYALDDQINCILDCVDRLEDALFCLEDYVDWGDS